MELTDIFHGTLVTLCRRLGIFGAIHNERRESSAIDPIADWQNPIDQECIKRSVAQWPSTFRSKPS